MDTRRRLVFLPFDVNLRSLPPELQRSQGDVEAGLRRRGPGILNWLIEGYPDFRRHGADMPESMSRLREPLEAADPVGVFLTEIAAKEAPGRLRLNSFYMTHEAWCEQEGRKQYRMKTAGDIMVEKGFDRGPINAWSHRRGLRRSDAACDLVKQATGLLLPRVSRTHPRFGHMQPSCLNRLPVNRISWVMRPQLWAGSEGIDGKSGFSGFEVTSSPVSPL